MKSSITLSSLLVLTVIITGCYASLIVHNDGYQDKGSSGTYDETLMLEKIISTDNSKNHADCLNFIIPSKKHKVTSKNELSR
ncbi:hypothetical protein YY19_01685 [Salmonella enterica subsp. enterica serovar Enteritidis]|nr:hypothetical protein [Salmonella enterica subsp. enterica serovar Enteritidis]